MDNIFRLSLEDNDTVLYKEYIVLKKKIQKEFIQQLYNKYLVFDRDGNQVLINEFSLELFKQCVGVNPNNKQCQQNALINGNYCAKHFKKYIKENGKEHIKENMKENLTTSDLEEISDTSQLSVLTHFTYKESLIDKETLQKKFIEDSFYYIDDKYIYDMTTLEKLGYIQNNRFILTNDPFILNNI